MTKKVPLSLLLSVACVLPVTVFAATELTTTASTKNAPAKEIVLAQSSPSAATSSGQNPALQAAASPQAPVQSKPDPIVVEPKSTPAAASNSPALKYVPSREPVNFGTMPAAAEPTPAPADSAAGAPLAYEATPQTEAAIATAAPTGKKAKKTKGKKAKAVKEEVAAENPTTTLATQSTPKAPVDDGKNFSNALSLAYANNPQIKAERESLKAVDESVNQAFSGFLPFATASGSKGRERDSFAHQKWAYGNTTNKGLDIQEDLFNGGESYASFKAAKERVKAGRAQLTAVEQQVLYDAVVAYTDVVEKQLVLEVNRNNVDVLNKQLEATRARFEVGELTRTDSAQSEARLARSRADERQAMGDLEAARATYKRVIGVRPPENLVLPPLPARLPESFDQATALALEAHPTLKASEHLAQAAEKNVSVRQAALLPDVSLNGSMRRTEGLNTTGGLARLDSDAVTVNVTIPLYQSGAEWSRIREAKNQASQAKFQNLDTQHAVVENVDRAWQDYMTAKAIIQSSEEALNAAEVALDGITQENQSGLRTILDVLDTEQEAFTARLNLVKARRAEKTQAYRLLAAVGRLTARDLSLPVELHDPIQHYDDVKFKLIGW